MLDELPLVQHQPISWMSAWCSLDASNQGRCELQPQDNIASRWCKFTISVCVRGEASRCCDICAGKTTYPIILSMFKQMGMRRPLVGETEATTTTTPAAAAKVQRNGV